MSSTPIKRAGTRKPAKPESTKKARAQGINTLGGLGGNAIFPRNFDAAATNGPPPGVEYCSTGPKAKSKTISAVHTYGRKAGFFCRKARTIPDRKSVV